MSLGPPLKKVDSVRLIRIRANGVDVPGVCPFKLWEIYARSFGWNVGFPSWDITKFNRWVTVRLERPVSELRHTRSRLIWLWIVTKWQCSKKGLVYRRGSPLDLNDIAECNLRLKMLTHNHKLSLWRTVCDFTKKLN